MTPEAINRLYNHALDLVDQGACVLLLPGELDDEYVVAGWAWSPSRPPLQGAQQTAYLARAAMKVREHFEVEHGLELA